MMTNNPSLKVSKAQARAAKKWMATPEYRARVRCFRERCEAGEVWMPEGIAEFLGLPLGYVVAMLFEHYGTGFVPLAHESGRAH